MAQGTEQEQERLTQVQIPRALWKRLKIVAAEREITVLAAATEAVEQYLGRAEAQIERKRERKSA